MITYETVPVIVLAKEAVFLSLFDSDIDGSCSVHGIGKVSHVDCLVGGRWVSLVDDKQDMSKYLQ